MNGDWHRSSMRARTAPRHPATASFHHLASSMARQPAASRRRHSPPDILPETLCSPLHWPCANASHRDTCSIQLATAIPEQVDQRDSLKMSSEASSRNCLKDSTLPPSFGSMLRHASRFSSPAARRHRAYPRRLPMCLTMTSLRRQGYLGDLSPFP